MPETYKQAFKQNYTDNVDLSIFNCGLERCASGHTWGPGIRDHYLVHLVVAGKGVFRLGGTEYPLQAGDMFLIKPSQLCQYQADGDDPWEYYWVGFNGAYANKLVAKLPFSEAEPIYHTGSVQEMQALQEALKRIYDSRGSEPQNETSMVGYLYLFIAELMKGVTEPEPRAASSGSQYVLNAIKYIQFNYSRDISIDDVAKSVGVSRSHLYRVFMSNLNESPIDYLTKYRVNEACNLLRSSPLSIAEVANSVGFFDQFYFSRVFKKIMGMPPSKYLSSLPAGSESHA